MWMPDQKRIPVGRGASDVTGKVTRKPEHRPQPVSLFGGRPQNVVLFRIQAGGREINVRFEGDLDGVLDHGDMVTVRGAVRRGVLDATEILDATDQSVIGRAKACFVATAVYGDPDAPDVAFLRRMRDERLGRSAAGRWLVRCYERLGPAWARSVADAPRARQVLRGLLMAPGCRLLRGLVSLGSPGQEDGDGR